MTQIRKMWLAICTTVLALSCFCVVAFWGGDNNVAYGEAYDYVGLNYKKGGAQKLSVKVGSLETCALGQNWAGLNGPSITVDRYIYAGEISHNTLSKIDLGEKVKGNYTLSAHFDSKSNQTTAGFMVTDSSGKYIMFGFDKKSEQILLGKNHVGSQGVDIHKSYNYKHNGSGTGSTNHTGNRQTINGNDRWRYDFKVQVYKDSDGIWKAKMSTRNTDNGANEWTDRVTFNLQTTINQLNTNYGTYFDYSDFGFDNDLKVGMFMKNNDKTTISNVDYSIVEISQWSIVDDPEYTPYGAQKLGIRYGSLQTCQLGRSETITVDKYIYANETSFNTLSHVNIRKTVSGTYILSAHYDSYNDQGAVGFKVTDNNGNFILFSFGAKWNDVFLGKNGVGNQGMTNRAVGVNSYQYGTTATNGKEDVGGVQRKRFDFKVRVFVSDGVWKATFSVHNTSVANNVWTDRYTFNLKTIMDAYEATYYAYDDFDWLGTLKAEIMMLNNNLDGNQSIVEISQWDATVITYDSDITVKDAWGNTVDNASTVPAGEYTAMTTYRGNTVGDGDYIVHIKQGDKVQAAAVNGVATYRFITNGGAIDLTSAIGNYLEAAYEYDYTTFTGVSDPSVLYDNGRYYMALMTNWTDHYPQYAGQNFRILEIFEGGDIGTLRRVSDATHYLVMDPAVMAHQICEKYNAMYGKTMNESELLVSLKDGGCYAPELQKIGDYYYITTAYLCKEHGASHDVKGEGLPGNPVFAHRATMILRSKSITSGWEVWAPHISTPITTTDLNWYGQEATWDTIDGTLFQGRLNSNDARTYTFLIVSKVHTCCGMTLSGGYYHYNGGTYEYAILNDDLTDVMYPNSTNCGWSTMFNALTVSKAQGWNTGHYTNIADNIGKVSDAPELYVNSRGELIMLWTTDYNGYIICQSKSSTGYISGNWAFHDLLYDFQNPDRSLGYDSNHHDDKVTGGHPGLFRTPEGQLYMAIHTCMAEADVTRTDGNISVGVQPKRICFIALKEDANGWLTWGIDPDCTLADYSGYNYLKIRTDSIETYELGKSTTTDVPLYIYSNAIASNLKSMVRLPQTVSGAFTFQMHMDYFGNAGEAGVMITDINGRQIVFSMTGNGYDIFVGKDGDIEGVTNRMSRINYYHSSDIASNAGRSKTDPSYYSYNNSSNSGLETINGLERYRFDMKVVMEQIDDIWMAHFYTHNSGEVENEWTFRATFNLQNVLNNSTKTSLLNYDNFGFTDTLNVDIVQVNIGTKNDHTEMELSQWSIVNGIV